MDKPRLREVLDFGNETSCKLRTDQHANHRDQSDDLGDTPEDPEDGGYASEHHLD